MSTNRPRWHDETFEPTNSCFPWEIFHENCKLGKFSHGLSETEIYDYLLTAYESLPYWGYPKISLPRRLPKLRLDLDKAILRRRSLRNMTPGRVKLEYLTALLHYGYGLNRSPAESGFNKASRVVPSAGALYPLEIFVHSAKVPKLPVGLFHFHPPSHSLRILREGDDTKQIAQCLVQSTIPYNASMLFFITAMFERSIFKYSDRGYRFALLEAGHVAQNINLVANALGLGCLNIGGFLDREMDSFLQLDGIKHSTVYVLAIGREKR